ncbi:MAG TPA: type II toxin-antitoxin system VapC family toxin [Mycobacteriales bacterium]|nr:type II toxin-antitoxin system VapC family toxin [Mycobacteriales bacterium]
MITAVDTSVLLDVFGADATFGGRSRAAVRSALLEGGLVACDVVWAEAAAAFPSADEIIGAMDRLGVRFAPLDAEVCVQAGGAWRSYRRAGGSRARILADFLIGAHAAARADRLLTRDRGFYRKHFDRLVVVDPSS